MNVFEEHQLFIPIINDSRFTLPLRAHCMAGKTGSFRRTAFDAMNIMQRENKLSVDHTNAETVRNALWEYYTNQIKEENACRARKNVYTAEGFSSCNEIPTPPKEPNTMAKTFETKHFVDGRDVTELSDDQLINTIRRLELEVEALRNILTPSKKIGAKIDELNAQREAIVALLDSRP